MATQSCRKCDGMGLAIRISPTDMYECGFVQEAISCPACGGSGEVEPKPESRYAPLWELLLVLAVIAFLCAAVGLGAL